MKVCLTLWFVLGTQCLKTVGGAYNSFLVVWVSITEYSARHENSTGFFLRLLCYVQCYTSS